MAKTITRPPAAKRGAGVAGLDRSPSHLLHRAQQLAQDLYAEEFGAGAITQRQYALLAALSDRDGVTQSELVSLTGIDRSTLADMAARMMRRGLITRARSEADGRANAVGLTDEGRMALEAARPKMARADQRLLRMVPDGERQALLKLLKALVHGAQDGAGNQASP